MWEEEWALKSSGWHMNYGAMRYGSLWHGVLSATMAGIDGNLMGSLYIPCTGSTDSGYQL
jgi:hypothetical protein